MAGNLTQTFSEYLTRFPDVQFDGEEAAPEKLLNSLQSRTIDVAVAPAGMEESGILARSVWSDRLMVALQSGHQLLPSDRIYRCDLRREVFVVPGGGIGPTLANLLAARLTGPGGRPQIIVQNSSLACGKTGRRRARTPAN